jgi:hypothetical protein
MSTLLDSRSSSKKMELSLCASNRRIGTSSKFPLVFKWQTTTMEAISTATRSPMNTRSGSAIEGSAPSFCTHTTAKWPEIVPVHEWSSSQEIKSWHSVHFSNATDHLVKFPSLVVRRLIRYVLRVVSLRWTPSIQCRCC